MCENSISKFVDNLDVNTRMYYVLILFLGITVFATRYIHQKVDSPEESHFVQEQNGNFSDMWYFSGETKPDDFIAETP